MFNISAILPILPKIFSAIGFGWDILKDVFGIGDKIGNIKQTNVDNCEITDLAEINSIFNEFICSIEPHVTKIEKSIQDEMYYYLDELIEFFDDNNEKLTHLGLRTNNFKRKIEKIKSNLDGQLKKEISKNISLDNAECVKIIKMLPGEKKSNKMDELFDLTLRESIQRIIFNTKELIEEFMDDIEISIEDQLKNLNYNIKEQFNALNVFNSATNEAIQEKESIVINAILLSQMSDCVLNVLR